MGKLFCIMGKSSTGKDTIYRSLLEEPSLGLKSIVLYTTRPIRDGEVDGVNYHFVDTARRDEILASGRVIEIRSYDTVYGEWDYFTVDDGQIDLDHYDYLVIGTLESYRQIRRYYGEFRVIPIYIEVEDGERLLRAVKREKRQKEPKYTELCRRFIADEEDFSRDKRDACGIRRIFHNEDLDDTVREISSYIMEKKADR